jgi:hypothetical protein
LLFILKLFALGCLLVVRFAVLFLIISVFHLLLLLGLEVEFLGDIGEDLLDVEAGLRGGLEALVDVAQRGELLSTLQGHLTLLL